MANFMHYPNLPLYDEADREIMKHKQVHFSASFPAMIAYYKQEGKGAVLATSVARLEELYAIEQATGHSLAHLILSAQDIEQIQFAKQAYSRLQAVAKSEKTVVNLLFSEKEQPKELIEQVSKEKKAFPLLFEILKTDNFYNPLFPGYGFAPALAAQALAQAQEKKAIPLLFERLGELDFEMESYFLDSLAKFGEEGRHFLLQFLRRKGKSKEMEQATLALCHFEPNCLTASYALRKLQELCLSQPDFFFSLLIEFCRQLPSKNEQQQFAQLKDKDKIHPRLVQEINQVKSRF